MRECCGLRKLSPAQLLPLSPLHPPQAHPAPGGKEGRIRRVKMRKIMGWDKDSLTGKAKATHTSKAKQGIHSPLPTSRQVFRHLQESRAPSCIAVTWEDRRSHSELPPSLSPSSPSFYCWAPSHAVWDIPFLSWGQLSQLCPLPTSCAPTACSLVGQSEKQKKILALCKHCSAIAQTYLFYQNCSGQKSKT